MSDRLTTQAQQGIQNTNWPALLLGSAGAFSIGMLSAAGLAPLLHAVGVGQLASGSLAQWLMDSGANVLAGWVGDLALWATRRPLGQEPVLSDLAAQLDEVLLSDQRVAADLLQLLTRIDALPLSLAALQERLADQQDRLTLQSRMLVELNRSLTGLAQPDQAFADVIIREARRLLAAFADHGQQIDAQFAALRADLQSLLAARRPGGVRFENVQAGDIRIGDIIFGDQHVNLPFQAPALSVTAATLAAAHAALHQLPTGVPIAPADTLPAGSWMHNLRRNQVFVGREQELLRIAAHLNAPDSQSQRQPLLLSGIGGQGKSQLAIEAVYRYGRYFSGVFWLDCSQPDLLPLELARCGGPGKLQLFSSADRLTLDEQVAMVLARWSSGLPYLIVFDHCDHPDLLRSYLPYGSARVLVTSRRAEWPADLPLDLLRLAPFARADSVSLLRRSRPELPLAEADAIAATLDDLPLAVHLAGCFLGGPGRTWNATQYLAELRSPRLFERLSLPWPAADSPTNDNHDLAGSFALSYLQLQSSHPLDQLSVRVLARAAYLAAGVTVEAHLLFASVSADYQDIDRQVQLNSAIDRLLQLGLIEQDSPWSIRVQRLLAAYIRQVSNDPTAQSDVEDVLLRTAQERYGEAGNTAIAAFQPLLQLVTDAAAGRQDARYADLCAWLVGLMERLGNSHLARSYAEQALHIRERLLGGDHPATATSLNDLGSIMRAGGDLSQARHCYERALAMRMRLLGEHPDTAATLNNLAYVYHMQHETARAEALYRQALAIYEQQLATHYGDYCICLNNFADLLDQRGEREKAQAYYERALELRELFLEPDHPDIADSLNNLAVFHQKQADWLTAGDFYQRAVAIYTQSLGLTHPRTVVALKNLAVYHREQGHFALAVRLMAQAYAVQQERWGDQHADTRLTHEQYTGWLHDLLAQITPFLGGLIRLTPGDRLPFLAELETQEGLRLADPIMHLAAGTRDPAVLTADLDQLETTIIVHLLGTLPPP